MTQEPPAVVKCGISQVEGSGWPLLIFWGTWEGEKFHILIEEDVHSMAMVPPLLELKRDPYGPGAVAAQPLKRSQVSISSFCFGINDWCVPWLTLCDAP